MNNQTALAATIKQRADRDCFLCCLAMAIGVTYTEVNRRLGAHFIAHVCANGLVGSKDLDTAFGGLGLMPELHYKVLFILPEYVATGFLRNVLWGRRACIQVRSKNYAGEHHIVYWDGEALHDPSNKNTYKWLEVEPINIWLFSEQSWDGDGAR